MNAWGTHQRRRHALTSAALRGAVAVMLIAATADPARAQGAPPAGPPAPGAAGGGGPAPAGRGAQAPRSAKDAAPVDLTGYWVSVVTEDWRWRMLTPAKGDFAGVPLNRAARQLGAAWDPAKDEAAGLQCKAYGAPAIMRVPGRLHITWADDNTLAIETDAGSQTRLLRFPGARPVPATAARPSWQGTSAARWEGIVRGPGEPDFLPIGLNPREGTRGRSLEVVTTNLRAGYLRKNGVPYSARTTLREYFDLSTERNGDTWFVVTTIVEDPDYLTSPFVTSSNFKKQPDASGWAPVPCSAR
jgi:hypothetical protein